MAKMKELLMDLTDDEIEFMDECSLADFDEVDGLRLLLQTAGKDLEYICKELDRMVERWKYYDERPDLGRLEDLALEAQKAKETLQ